MKLKNNYYYEFFKYYTDTQSFLFIFIISIVFAAYGAIGCINYSYLSSFTLAFNNSFYIMGLLLIFFANTRNTYSLFKKNYEYIIRCHSRKKYLTKLIQNVMFNNLILFIINVLLIMIFLNLFSTNNKTLQIKDYSIPIVMYLIYCLVKFLCLSEIMSVINICLFEKINTKIVGIANVVFTGMIPLFSLDSSNISSITKLPLSINAYLLSLGVTYSSFIFELLCFIIYFLILCTSVSVFFKFVVKEKRDI